MLPERTTGVEKVKVWVPACHKGRELPTVLEVARSVPSVFELSDQIWKFVPIER